jgi:hypothetical protein
MEAIAGFTIDYIRRSVLSFAVALVTLIILIEWILTELRVIFEILNRYFL